LELLLCTPLGVGEIVRGRLQALHRQFLWPSVAVVLIDLGYLAFLVQQGGWTESRTLIALYACLIGVLICDMAALAWLGMWWSVVSRRASRAWLRSVSVVFALPWLILVVALTLVLALRIQLPDPEELVLLAAYAGVSLLVSGAAWWWGRRRLLGRLRTVGTPAPQAKPEPTQGPRASQLSLAGGAGS
jgi:hypothetical protein